MDFKLGEEQEQFQDSFKSLLGDKCTPEKVREVWGSNSMATEPRIKGLWEQIAELGALGVQAPEKAGGLDLSEVELILLMEVAGYYALPEPFLEHAGIAVPALSAAPVNSFSEDYLVDAVNGENTISVGSFKYDGNGSRNTYAGYGELADAFLLSDGSDLYLLPISKVKIFPQKSLEAPKNPVRVEWEADSEFLLPAGDLEQNGAAELAFERGALAAAAECLGLAQRLLDMTVEYAKERVQFGKPIGSQQAIKHHLAEIAISLAHSRPSVYAAACTISSDKKMDKKQEISRDVSAAKAMASETASMAARKALQCHGAIGYTLESDLSIWLKKAWVVANSWGNAGFHLNRLAKILRTGQ